MVEESESMGAVGAISSTDSTRTYDYPPYLGAEQSGSAPGAASAAATATPEAAGASRAMRPMPAAIGTQSAPSQPPSAEELASVAEEANAHLAIVNRVLELNVDQGSGLTIATIRNSQTGEVLQQFPSANIVHLAQMLADWSPGKNVLLDLIA
jgi:uncharacterized FlaG/YvyC family protein